MSSGSNGLEADRISKADRVIGCRGRKPEAAMKIELLMRRKLVCRAEVDCVLRAAALGERPGIFNVGVPRRRKLPVKIHTGLAG